jgi:hypothetical protein
VKTFLCGALIAASLFLGSISPLFAQLVSDPNDRLYTDLELWMDRGLTDKLPPLRPYPIQLVKKILTDVKAKGNAADQELAAFYISKIDGRSNVHAIASALARTDFTDKYAELGLLGSLQGSLVPWITYSGKIGVVATSDQTPALLPDYQRSLLDYVPDSVSPILHFFPRMSMIGSGTVGTDSIYFQAGAIRGSYGPFWGDNAVLSPDSPQTGQFSFVYHDNIMSLTIALMALSASDAYGNGLYPDKWLALDGLEFYPADWLTLGVFDAMVWGQYFTPLYMLPVVAFYTEGMVGYPDNAFIGLSGEVKFPAAIKADALLYVDDASFNDLIRLNFNTMLLVALQAGVSWTPNLPFLTRIRITNLLITPYTYSHETYGGAADTGPNYLNYTNQGTNIGPSIQPNSDRIEIEALARPLSWLDVTGFGSFIIHGNASSDLPYPIIGVGDGSVFDNGADASGYTFAPNTGRPAGWTYDRFLTQAVLEKVFQAGFTATSYLETPIGEIEVELGYTFEYILDGTIVGTGPVSGNDSINNYLSLGVTFTY